MLAQEVTMGHVTLTMPSLGLFIIHRIELNLCTKSEDSSLTYFKVTRQPKIYK